ncbi:MAG: extracellular solute-binding protein [Clostridia bacterium]|nr:extracellular solute-binding protein [Clostridia bacterium]
MRREQGTGNREQGDRRFRFSICLLLALLALTLAGCHGSRGRGGFEVPEAFDTSRQYEISFWAKNDTNKTQTEIYKRAISGFEALYPNVKVTLKLYTDYGRIYNDVITNISTDTTPNVCVTYPDHIATYLTGNNVVVPLDGLMDDGRYGLGGSEVRFDGPAKSEVIPQFLKECAISGSTYALPFMRSTEALYINRTYVEALGYRVPDVVTWDFVWEVAEAATKKDAEGVFAVNGQKVMIPFIYKSTDNMMIQMLRQLDAGYSTDAGEILLLNDTTKALLEGIADHARTGAFSTFKISSYPANFLNAGQCVFAVDSTAGATWMGSDAPLLDISADSVVRFETAVRPVPQFDPEHPQMISQGPSVCVFNKKDPQEVLAAWLFAQYLLTNDVQIAYAQTEGYVPVTGKAQGDAAYQTYLNSDEGDALHYPVKLQAAKLLLENTGNTFTTPVFNGSASLRDAAGQLIENVTKSVRRKQTVDDAYFEKLYRDVTDMYELNQPKGGDAPSDLGPLPAGAKALLIGLAAVWVLLAARAVADLSKRRGR